MNDNKMKINIENSEKSQRIPNLNKNKNNNTILISAKKTDCELKKKKLEETTYILISNLLRILKNEKIRELSFSFIHNLSYNITIEKGGEYFTLELNKNLQFHLALVYENCLNYLKISENNFIRFMIECYYDYINKISIIQKTLMYYERNYLLKNNLNNVKINSKRNFEEIFLNSKICEILKLFILDLIDKDRKNKFIDKILLNDISRFLLDINKEIYLELIEKNILVHTKVFYEQEYIKNIELKSSSEFSLYAKHRHDEENQRITDLNFIKSKDKILEIFKSEFIEKFFSDKDKIIPYVINLLKSNDKNNLLILKEIAIFDLNDEFYKIFAKSIEVHLTEIIKEKKDDRIKVMSIIEDILSFLDKIEQFKKDLNILNKQNYLNLIKHHIQYSINNKNFPFLISKILPKNIDTVFKHFFKNRIGNFEVNNYLERVLNLFRSIDDKDIFEIEFRKLLQNRLLNNYFFEEAEMKILGKLKLESGAVFTHRCEVMISDIKDSVRLTENYFNSNYSHKKTKNNHDVDFNVKVLTGGNWIVKTSENLKIEKVLKFSEDSGFKFVEFLENFDDYYTKHYHNKILNYNLFLSTCEIFVKIKMRNYQIVMNSFQAFLCMCIKSGKISLHSIFELFGVFELSSVLGNIIQLVKSGLVKASINDFNELLNKIKEKKYPSLEKCDYATLNEFSKIYLEINRNFFCKHQIINILNFSNLNEQDSIFSNESKSEEAVFAERKYLIDSNIIRLMKSKQNINHNELTNEVIKSIQQSFLADMNNIKQRIESLIERGFIKRAEDNYNNYIYNS